MRSRHASILAVACGVALAFTAEARAVSPRNPYRSFNPSGLNYGSMQWEKAQRQGKRVWPYSNTPSRNYERGGNVSVGGFSGAGGGAIIQGSGSSRSGRGLFRRR
ncbi:MAG: hypothetical protein ACKOCX_03165 [Planctomycetota bacterium]